jgi:hypothetical protein
MVEPDCVSRWRKRREATDGAASNGSDELTCHGGWRHCANTVAQVTGGNSRVAADNPCRMAPTT